MVLLKKANFQLRFVSFDRSVTNDFDPRLPKKRNAGLGFIRTKFGGFGVESCQRKKSAGKSLVVVFQWQAGCLEEEDVFSFVYDIDHLTIFFGVEQKFCFFAVT